jgi:hypothetical protein
MEKLNGLNPDQVIANLGSPDFGDPRGTRWTSEATDGPLYLYYHGGFNQEYAILFKDNRVAEVKRIRK